MFIVLFMFVMVNLALRELLFDCGVGCRFLCLVLKFADYVHVWNEALIVLFGMAIVALKVEPVRVGEHFNF